MLDGSGMTVEVAEKTAEAPMGPAPATCEKLKLITDTKGPAPWLVKSVPGVHIPAKPTSRPAGVTESEKILIPVKVPKLVELKVKLMGLARFKRTVPKFVDGKPRKMPLWTNVEVKFGIEKVVAVPAFPVSVVVRLKVLKPWSPTVVACTLVVADKQIASRDSAKRVTGRIANLLY